MIVIADSGPIIHLSMIGMFDLIYQQFKRVIVPNGVYREVVEEGVGRPGAQELAAAGWIERLAAPAQSEVQHLLGHLDSGEQEAIALAFEKKASWLLIDDLQGRLAAEQLGLRVVGTLGILIAAKSSGQVEELAPLMTALQREGFWMSAPLAQRVLISVGEGLAASSWTD